MTHSERRRTRDSADDLSLGEFIRDRHEDILNEWMTEVRHLPIANALDRPALLDHIPDILDRIAEMSDALAKGSMPALPKQEAQRHADIRLDEGFDLPQVVAEFAVLRDCIMRLWELSVADPQHLIELRVVNQAIDKAVTASVITFTRARDRTMLAIDRIASEALESRSLDELLQRLLKVFVEFTAAVDTAAILIRDGDCLRVRAALGLRRETELGFTVKVGEGFAGTIARDRRPLAIAPIATDIAIKSNVLRSTGIRALYGVPLIDGGSLVGVAHMGSLTANEFSVQDKRLLAAMANRATAAIFQHVLRERAERTSAELSAILESIPAAVYIGDASSISKANRAGLDLLGCDDAAELAERPVASLVRALDMREPATNEPIDADNGPVRTAARGKRYARDLIVRDHTTDQDVIVHAVAAPISLDGDVIGAVAVNVDVTARRRMEETLRERELELRTLADNIPQLAWIADNTGSLYWFNQRWFDYTGTTLADVAGSGWKRVHHPEHVDRVIDEFARAIAREQEWEDLFPLRSSDGRYRWFLSRAMPVRDERGEVQRWFGTNTDVTEQRFLVAASGVLASSLDVTKTLEQLTQLAVPDIADECAVDVLKGDKLERVAETPSAGAVVSSDLEMVLRTGAPAFYPEVTDDRLREHGVSSCIIAPLTARGQTLGTITLTRTGGRKYGQSKVETAIELGRRAGCAVDNAQLYAASQEATRARQEILAIVSHDLRTPLASIDLAATMVLEAGGLAAQAQKHVEMIQRSASRMEHLLRDLLDTTSLQVGRFAMVRSRFDAAALLSGVAAAHDELAAQHGIKLVCDCKLAGHQIDGDLERVVQALGNIVGNAIKFSRRGDTVIIRGTAEDAHITLSVTDTGPGIRADELPHIFEPYWSAKRHAKKGTGLGLYICKSIIEAHGGTISVQSKLATGTAFVVKLPVVSAG